LLLAAATGVAQSPLEDALKLTRERHYAEARRALQGAVEPVGIAQRIAFHRLKAAIASGLGEGATAASEMRAALALNPGDVPLRIAAAAAELQAGELDQALEHALAGAGTAVGQALLGDIHEKRGESVEALKAYQEAVRLAPESEQYRVALALELVQHYTFEPAIAVLEQAAPRFPKSARIRTLLGMAQYAAGRYEDAEASLTDALRLDPAMEPVYVYLARVAIESPSEPPESALSAICSRDQVTCAALRARSARAAGDTDALAKAVAELKRAPADNAVAKCELGRAYQESGAWTEARGELEACVRIDPSPQNHYRLGLVYNRLGLAALAREQMDLRAEAERRKADETARRQSAVEAFQILIK
jgi:tetratricopeptide (TPR) repeat protein